MEKRFQIILFLALAWLYTVPALHRYEPYNFLEGDGAFYAQTVRSIVRYGTLRQEKVHPRSWYQMDLGWNRYMDDAWSDIGIGPKGKWYPKHSILMPIVAIPFFLIFGLDGLLIFNLLGLTLAVWVGFLMVRRLFGPLPAFIALLLIATQPAIIAVGYSFKNDVFYTLLVLVGLYFYVQRRPAISGLFIGFSIFAKITSVLLVGPVCLALAFYYPFRQFRRFAVYAIFPLILFGLSNTYMYGAPWLTGYNVVGIRKGLDLVVTSHVDDMTVPFKKGVSDYITAQWGFWPQAFSIFIGMLASLLLLFRKPVLATGFILAYIAFFIFFAQFKYQHYRFALPWVLISMIPIGGLTAMILNFSNRTVARLKRNSRLKWGLISGAGLLLIGWLIYALVLQAGRRYDILQDLEELEVKLDETPCDYFNLQAEKWECSQLDRGNEYFTGRAIWKDCPFENDSSKRFLILPAHPGRKTRTVLWRLSRKGYRSLFLKYGLDQRTNRPHLKFTVFINGKVAEKMEVSKGNRAQKKILRGTEAIETVRLEIPGQMGFSRLCVNLVPLP